jgi:hypothetical protein
VGWTKKQRRIAIGTSVWLLGAVFVLGGGVALADVVPDITQVVDPVEEVIDAVDDPVNEVIDAVDDPMEAVIDAVDDPVDGGIETVDDTVNGVTGVVANAANEAASTAGAAPSAATASGGEGASGSAAFHVETGGPAARKASTANLVGRTGESAWVPYGLREPVPAVAGWGGPIAEPGQNAAQADPCEQDESLVCLGVLYGLGEFADAGTEVLGVLVTTGAAVVGLLVLAAGLAVAGVWALVASTSAGPAGRAVEG